MKPQQYDASDKEFTLNKNCRKKIVSVTVAVLMLLSVCFAVFGADAIRAESGTFDPLAASSTSIEADPPRLSSAGYVTIIIKLHNGNSVSQPGSIGVPELNLDPIPTPAPSDDPGPVETEKPTEVPYETTPPYTGDGAYTNISIANSYGVQFNTPDVPAGSTGTFRGSMMITESMIGSPLTFTIYWHDNSDGVNYYKTLSVTVQRSDTAYLRLTRTASVTSAAPGEPVVLTYTMVNTGTRRLNNITLTDEKINGRSALTSPFSLSSGETKVVEFTYTMQGESVTSKPTATFTPDGSSTALSVTISNLTIGLVNAQLSKSVNVGNATADGVLFTLFLTNNGSQNLSGLTVKNDLGETLSSGFSLAIGESKIIEHFVPNPSTVRNVFFTITGTYASGKVFTDNTTSYTVRPYIDPNTLGLKFTAEITKQLSSENRIIMTFNVRNTGRVPYTELKLTEAQLGYELHRIEELAPSAEESFSVDLTLEGPRELVFILTANDPSGNEYSYEAVVNAEYQDLESAIPNVTPEPGGESGTTIVDINIDNTINERGEKLLHWWHILEIIFFAALALIALLGGIEIWLYFKNKNKQKNN